MMDRAVVCNHQWQLKASLHQGGEPTAERWGAAITGCSRSAIHRSGHSF